MIETVRTLAKRVVALFRRRRAEAEFSAELESHLDALRERNIRRGMTPDEARFAARREFGGIEQIRELHRHQRGLPFLETLLQDLRFSVRILKSSPALTLIAVLSLAIGIGGNAAMFSLVDGLLLRPLPYRHAERLVAVTGFYPQGALRAIGQRSRTMEVAAYTPDSQFSLTGQGEAMRLEGSAVSDNLFSLLSVEPTIGSAFRAGENSPGRDRLVLLSHALWRSKFASDSRIVGHSILIDGVAREVVGVMPADFAFPSSEVQIWIPLRSDPTDVFGQWNTGFLPLVGRLRDGRTLEQAQNELRALIPEIIPLFPYKMPRVWNSDATVVSLKVSLVSGVRSKLLVLQSAIGLVLLITCVNVASLLLSRASSRQKEMALRSALGASRGRIVRQLLTESVVLALLGGGLGTVLAYEGLFLLKMAVQTTAPGFREIHLDGTVLAFVAVLALGAGFVFGLFPALGASKTDLAAAIRSGGRRSSGSSGSRLRGFLIAAETALAVLLAVSAGLLIKSLWRLTEVQPGFRSERILTAGIFPNQSACQERSSCAAFYRELLLRAHEIPGVSGVAAANVLPLAKEIPEIPAELEGRPVIPGETTDPMLWAGAVTPEYFLTLDIPLLEGRIFTDLDSESSTPVIVISKETASRFWPGKSAVGKHIRAVWEGEPWRTVVGVVGDVRQHDLSGRIPADLQGALYMPYSQAVGIDRRQPQAMSLIVRTNADEATAAARIRELVGQVNPDVPVGRIRSLDGIVSAALVPSRSMMWLFLCFAGVALALAAIGTYGVISYSTNQRLYEMGVRIALGASPGRIFGLILGQSLRLALAGLAGGILASFFVTRILKSFLYGVAPRDPLTFLVVAALLIAVALIAGFLPARRAASVDPNVALRHD